MEDVNVIVSSSSLVIESPLSDEYLKKLEKEAQQYRSDEHILERPYYTSGKESRRTRRKLELRKKKGRL